MICFVLCRCDLDSVSIQRSLSCRIHASVLLSVFLLFYCFILFFFFYYCFFLMIRRPPRSTLDRSSAASDVYKRQVVFAPKAPWWKGRHSECSKCHWRCRWIHGKRGRRSSCLLYTSPSPRDRTRSRMPSSAWKKKTNHHTWRIHRTKASTKNLTKQRESIYWVVILSHQHHT